MAGWLDQRADILIAWVEMPCPACWWHRISSVFSRTGIANLDPRSWLRSTMWWNKTSESYHEQL